MSSCSSMMQMKMKGGKKNVTRKTHPTCRQ